jgi:hypothetical protein
VARAWDAKKFDSVYSEFISPYFDLSGPPNYCCRYPRVTRHLSNGFVTSRRPLPWMYWTSVEDNWLYYVKSYGMMCLRG